MIHYILYFFESWNDIGTKDLPAIIDKIISLTGQEKIHYIGHMQGSTVFYVMASERPEYMSKIEKMVSLGPVAYMGHASNEVIKTVESHMTSKSVSYGLKLTPYLSW